MVIKKHLLKQLLKNLNLKIITIIKIRIQIRTKIKTNLPTINLPIKTSQIEMVVEDDQRSLYQVQ
jgi:hypothetical protein